jgi:hypothetical protein
MNSNGEVATMRKYRMCWMTVVMLLVPHAIQAHTERRSMADRTSYQQQQLVGSVILPGPLLPGR